MRDRMSPTEPLGFNGATGRTRINPTPVADTYVAFQRSSERRYRHRAARKLDDQVVARLRECWQAPVEAGEESWTEFVPPIERAAVVAPLREHAGPHQLVGGNVQEGLVQRGL
jgi:hypothetical protein